MRPVSGTRRDVLQILVVGFVFNNTLLLNKERNPRVNHMHSQMQKILRREKKCFRRQHRRPTGGRVWRSV